MDTKPVRIYSADDLPRLKYIAGILLGDILGLRWEVVTDRRKFGKHPVINYSREKIPGCFRVCPDGLLSETDIRPREIQVSEWKGLPVFFEVDSGSDLPFDIFAASFYLVGRYEEYTDKDPDESGCFRASSSLAFRHGFLGRPVVDLWARELARALLGKFQTLAFRRNEFKSILTFDIGLPYSSPGRTLLDSLGGLLRDFTGTEGHPGGRNRITGQGGRDTGELLDYILANIEKHLADARFFFPVGDHSRHFKNPSWKNEDYRKLINRVSGQYKTGLMHSLAQALRPDLLAKERDRLCTITGREICMCRFQLSRFSIPAFYVALSGAGMTEDYSMGYAGEPGFRAGIARPFHFYNLELDRPTSLKLIPFQFMGSYPENHIITNPQTAKEKILSLISETRNAGGTFVSIWHNTSLLDSSGPGDWRELFEFMLKNQVT